MTPKEIVDAWNRDNVTGRAVVVDRGGGSVMKTVTLTDAFLRGKGSPAVHVEGIQGSYSLMYVRPYDGVEDVPEVTHADSRCVCKACGRFYSRHPADLEHLGPGGVPFLTLPCSGRSVKL